MNIEKIIIKETILHNNCPECYATKSLVLSFVQEKNTSKFMTKTSDQVTEQIVCNTCNSTIFPGQWNKDIERVYEYHKKTIPTLQKSVQYTLAFYGVIGICAIMIVAISYGLWYILK